MFDSLLLPVDDTRESERILPVAAAIARLVGATIELVTIDAPHTDVAEMSLYHDRLLRSLPAGIQGRGTVVIGDDPVVQLLLDTYRARPTALLALATRAPGSLWQWLGGGSIGDEVVEETLRPVLLAGPRCDLDRAAAAIAASTVAALDGTVLDDQVYAAAVDWCSATGSPLTLTRVVFDPSAPRSRADAVADVELRAHEARRFVDDVRIQVVDAGDPARAVLQQVGTAGGLLVVGSHRRGPLGRMIHGSNALWLTHRSPVPVLVAGFRARALGTPTEAVATAERRPTEALCTPGTLGELLGWDLARREAG